MDTKQFCSFCKLYGHNVKSSNGDILCPSLLTTKCNFCLKMGHTIKNCHGLKGKYNPQYKNKNDEKNIKKDIRDEMYDKYGKFWALLVEDTKDDNIIACNIRRGNDAYLIRKDFRHFLNNKYRSNWLYKSEFGTYDCSYLEFLRDQELENDREREMYKRRRMERNNDIFSPRHDVGHERIFNNNFFPETHVNDQMPNESRLNNWTSSKRKFDF